MTFKPFQHTKPYPLYSSKRGTIPQRKAASRTNTPNMPHSLQEVYAPYTCSVTKIHVNRVPYHGLIFAAVLTLWTSEVQAPNAEGGVT